VDIDRIQEQLKALFGKLSGREDGKKRKNPSVLKKALKGTAGGAAAGAGIGAGIGYGEKMKALHDLLGQMWKSDDPSELGHFRSALSRVGLDTAVKDLRRPGNLGGDLASVGKNTAKHMSNLAKDLSGREELEGYMSGNVGKRTAQGAGVGAGAGLGISLLSALLDRKLGEKIRK
jgi:hypothetical protein